MGKLTAKEVVATIRAGMATVDLDSHVNPRTMEQVAADMAEDRDHRRQAEDAMIAMAEALAEKEDPKPGEPPPWQDKKLKLDDRLIELTKADPGCIGWSTRELAEATLASHSGIRRTAWYKERQKRQAEEKQRRERLAEFGE